MSSRLFCPCLTRGQGRDGNDRQAGRSLCSSWLRFLPRWFLFFVAIFGISRQRGASPSLYPVFQYSVWALSGLCERDTAVSVNRLAPFSRRRISTEGCLLLSVCGRRHFSRDEYDPRQVQLPAGGNGSLSIFVVSNTPALSAIVCSQLQPIFETNFRSKFSRRIV